MAQDRNNHLGFTSKAAPCAEVYLDTVAGYGSTGTTTTRWTNTRKLVGPITYVKDAVYGDYIVIGRTNQYSITGHMQSGAELSLGITVNMERGSLNTAVQNLSYANGRRQIAASTPNSQCSVSQVLSLNQGDIIRLQTNGVAASASARDIFQIIELQPRS